MRARSARSRSMASAIPVSRAVIGARPWRAAALAKASARPLWTVKRRHGCGPPGRASIARLSRVTREASAQRMGSAPESRDACADHAGDADPPRSRVLADSGCSASHAAYSASTAALSRLLMETDSSSCRCAICALIEARPDGMFDQRVLAAAAVVQPGSRPNWRQPSQPALCRPRPQDIAER